MKTAWMVLVVVSGSRIASAETAVAPAAAVEEGGARSEVAEAPGFVAIDRLDGSSRVGVELSYVGFDDDTFFDGISLVRVEGHARYVDRRTGIGGYAQLPFAYLYDSSGGQSNSVTDVGDLELGGIYAPRLGVPGLGLVVHAGVTLPTGETGSEAGIGTVANFVALPEAYNSLPKATTIKLGASPMYRRGPAFARLALGLDWNLDADTGSFGGSFGMGIHVDAGVGIELGRAAITLESANLIVLDSGSGASGASDGFTLHQLAVSVRGNLGAVSPYVAVLAPLGDELSALSILVTGGVEYRL